MHEPTRRGKHRLATMGERMAALREVDKAISKIRGARARGPSYRPRVTGRVLSVRDRSERSAAGREIPREPSRLELAFDCICRQLLRNGMTRRELRAKVERGLAEAELVRRKVKPRT